MCRKGDVLTRPYSPPVRTRTSGAQDGGRNERMRDNNLKSRDGISPKTVESDIKDSTEPGSRKVREETGLHPEDAGKPRGFGRRYVGARTPLNEHSCFCVECNYVLYRECSFCAIYVSFACMTRYSYVIVSAVECFDSLLRFDQFKLNSLNLLIAAKRNW